MLLFGEHLAAQYKSRRNKSRRNERHNAYCSTFWHLMDFEFFGLEMFVHWHCWDEKANRSHTFSARWCFMSNGELLLGNWGKRAICQREILKRFVCPSFRLDYQHRFTDKENNWTATIKSWAYRSLDGILMLISQACYTLNVFKWSRKCVYFYLRFPLFMAKNSAVFFFPFTRFSRNQRLGIRKWFDNNCSTIKPQMDLGPAPSQAQHWWQRVLRNRTAPFVLRMTKPPHRNLNHIE